VEDWTVF